MDKKTAISLYGTQTALAKALGITKQAISQWDDGQIPELQELKLRYVLNQGEIQVDQSTSCPCKSKAA